MSNYYERIEDILKRLDEQMKFVVAKMKLNEKNNPEDVFFDNQEFLKLMNISKRTAQSWRDEGKIAFSQIGSKIYYKMADVTKLLNNNYKPEFKNR